MSMYYGNQGFSWGNQPQLPSQADNHQIQLFTLFEPFMYQTLISLINQHVVVETDKGALRGQLIDVKIDHIALEISGNIYFVRIQEISWVMPTQFHDSK
ncbi:YuzF family protein [Piscibacillus salipiscarius]|uniref:YuzF family protein n=1 Tax=Piscibacillus salipiscarius TaxID=299480 RepID=A0ABW5Q7X9_9BACI